MGLIGTKQEELIKDSIWEKMRVSVTVNIKDDLVEILPDSFVELAEYWGVSVDSTEFDNKLVELEKEWEVKLALEEELVDNLTRYYEIDLDNCLMTNLDWVKELAKALTDKDYLANLKKEFHQYNEDRD